MRERLVDLLRCPIDGSPLQLIAWDEERRPLEPADRDRAESLGLDVDRLERWIETGLLVNPTAGIGYPIHAGIPRMLTFTTGVVERFWQEHRARLEAELPGIDHTRQGAPPGEQEILRTFSTEWEGYEWDGERFWSQNYDDWFRSLDTLIGLDEPVMGGTLALEVGIGIGGLANHVSRTKGFEVVGVDLGYAVDQAVVAFADNPFLHVVQASAFDLPFASATFDLVLSLGVLHHTWSTEAAFQSVARSVAPGGHFFIWLYSPQEANSTRERRILMALEHAARPTVSRLPTSLQTAALTPVVPIYVVRQAARRRGNTEGYAKYGWNEGLHAARDRLTPRFAHRHSEEEVRTWFRRAGFVEIVGNSARPETATVPDSLRLSTGVRGTRGSARVIRFPVTQIRRGERDDRARR